ncbi:MAG: 50S ribosomal protein L13 [Candidatus Aenigmarchaeota archaeon]|nr:50S ribosomal protein L13 [Candidatus Aenigmarchaeota archaeon]
MSMAEAGEKRVVVDAAEQVMGRVCSNVAKRLLNGQNIVIINAERAVVTGRPEMVLSLYREKRERGDPHHGPFYPTLPEAIIKRGVRGMLPYKQARGRDALRRLRVYAGNPINASGQQLAKKPLTHKYVTLAEVSKSIRGG